MIPDSKHTSCPPNIHKPAILVVDNWRNIAIPSLEQATSVLEHGVQSNTHTQGIKIPLDTFTEMLAHTHGCSCNTQCRQSPLTLAHTHAYIIKHIPLSYQNDDIIWMLYGNPIIRRNIRSCFILQSCHNRASQQAPQIASLVAIP